MGDKDFEVIAEIGSNHGGDLQKAKDLIYAAKECGADAVKLQKRDNKNLYTRELYDSPYENENSFGKTYGEHREFLEFGWEEYESLLGYARSLSIDLFATAFDFNSVDFLDDIGVSRFKIASGDLTNTPLIEYIARFRKPIIISTGGGTIDDVSRAYRAAHGCDVTLLQCTASYPTKVEEMNLNVILTYKNIFQEATIGLSDHQNGIEMSVIAYMLGARVFEKHFTLDHTWKGTDNAFSLQPEGMRKMVRDLSRIQTALGDREKKPLPSEEKPLYKMGKSLVASRDMKSGEYVTINDIAIKSPGGGIQPYDITKLIGSVLESDIKEDECF